MKSSLAALAVVTLALMVSACAMNIPQTRAEYTSHTDVQKQTYTVPRRLDAVVASLEKQAKACLNYEYKYVRPAGGIAPSSHDMLYVTITKPSANRAELTCRKFMSSTVGQPDGGFYYCAANLKSVGPQTTEVTLYYASIQSKLANALKEWSKGNDKSCQGYSK